MRRGNRGGIRRNVWIRSNVLSCVCVLTESDKCTLIDVLQQGTSLLRFRQVSIYKDTKGFRMVGYECRMNREYCFIGPNEEPEGSRGVNTVITKQISYARYFRSAE